MKPLNSLFIIIRVLCIGLFLQSCTDLANSPFSKDKKDNRLTKNPNIQAALNKAFLAESDHMVTFYETENELKAYVQVNALDEVDKFYSGINVVIETGVDLAELARLDKATQKRRIQVQFNPKGTPTAIVVHKPWLLGGAPDEVIMFCGNPQIGKSTLLNSIFQKAIFQSGINLGRNMTTNRQEYIYNNKLYIDTPGLDDISLRRDAAKQIEEALKGEDDFKLVFVARLESGRIKPADLTTINIVCNAIQTKFEYGIIFNEVEDKDLEANTQSRCNLNDFLAKSGLNKQPSSAVFLTKENDLEYEDNVYLKGNNENREKLINFLDILKANRTGYNQKIQTIENRLRNLELEVLKLKVELERKR